MRRGPVLKPVSRASARGMRASARALSSNQGQAEAVAVTPAARIALVMMLAAVLRVRPGAVALAVAAPVVPP